MHITQDLIPLYMDILFDIWSKRIRKFVVSFSHPYSRRQHCWCKCRIFDMQCTNFSSNHPFAVEIIVALDAYAIKISLNDGFAYIKKKDISFFDKEKVLRVGDRFFTPEKFLIMAKDKRCFYTANGVVFRN